MLGHCPKQQCHFTFPPVVQGGQFLCILTDSCYCPPHHHLRHPVECDIISDYAFSLSLSVTNNSKPCSCSSWQLVHFLWRDISNDLPIFKVGYSSFYCCKNSFYVLDMSLARCVVCKRLSLIPGVLSLLPEHCSWKHRSCFVFQVQFIQSQGALSSPE